MQNDNFWQSELRKMFANSASIEDLRFTGRVAMGRLGDELSVKLKLATLGVHAHYEGVEAAVVNRREGVIDRTTFRFGDVIGEVERQHGTPQKMFPYIWDTDGKPRWFGYSPAPRDYEKITECVDDYLEIFQEPVQRQAPDLRQTM